MKKVTCIIIEDEYPALEIIKGYLKNVANWEIKASFNNALDAISYLSDNQIDVIFLDIQLPKLSGINFIKALDSPAPLIIITSAYSEHAVEAFELIVFDYLLKPFSFQRFIKTTNRVNNYLSDNSTLSTIQSSDYIIVKEKRNNIKVLVQNISYIESQKEYVKIVCDDGSSIHPKIGISKMEKLLPTSIFLRVHRSYLIAIPKILSFTKKQIEISGNLIPIGRYYQKIVMEQLE